MSDFYTATSNTIYDTMFALLRTALWGENRFPVTAVVNDVDWQAVYRELRHQTVQNIALDQLCFADPAHKSTYMQASMAGIQHYYRLLQSQQATFRLLQEAGIGCVILKGAAAAQYYPIPSYRCMGDVDIIARPEDFQRAFELLCKNGYEFDGVEDQRHLHLKHQGVLYELHRFFALLNDGEQAAMLDNMIFQGISQACEVSLDGYSFPSLPAVANGLVLLEHICQHLESGLGLRQIVDWMMYADRELNDSAWVEYFQPVVRTLGLETLAITVTRMCQNYLGLRQDITWCTSADSTLCDELLALLMENGNFGRKQDSHTNKSVSTLLAARNPILFLRRLQQYGSNNWELLKRYPQLRPWLTPFAWLYQLCRYIYKGFANKHPLRSLRRNLHKSNEQNALMDRLQISRRSKGCETPFGTRF